MLNIINNTGNPKIDKAISILSKHYLDQAFLQSFKDITFSCHSPYTSIINTMNSNHPAIHVNYFTPHWLFSKAIAKYSNNEILFNRFPIRTSPVCDILETLFHELCHHWGFVHVSNYQTPYNLDTVPYKLSSLFKSYIISSFPLELL